ncbi:MAG: ABC transporter substrate-binding protein [Candidatus Colwellbacteria bacterium]|nr:ABC transporter substrate-binding protein [Candidatus Colwellbacteria bacterium]
MKLLFRNPIPKLVKALSKKERLVFYVALAVFSASLLTYSALFVKTGTYVLPAAGGTYREGMVGQPAFINPILPSGASTETDRLLSRLVFASLADMAETVKHSADGKIWNVRLKDGIRWHDGEKVTADDVVFTVDTIQNPEMRSWLQGSFEGVTVSRVSELEVEFTLQNSYAFFAEDHLASFRPIPKHIFADIPAVNFTRSSFGLAPIGSGLYRVASHEKDSKGYVETLTLESNRDYFERSAYIENLIFNFFKKEADLVSAYNLGQLDGFGLSTAESLSERPILIRHQLHYLSSSRYYAIFINQNVAPNALSDVSVREELSAAIDRDELIDTALNGQGTPFFGPTHQSPEPTASFSTEGFEGLNLRLIAPEESFLVKTAEKVKKDWEFLGIQTELIVRSSRDIQQDILPNANYEMLLFGNIVKENGDLFAFWHSSKTSFPDQNLALYQSSYVDGLLETYRTTFDEETRVALLQKIGDTIADDFPAIFLYSPNYVYITTPSLGGFDDQKIINTSDDRFADVADWFVKSNRSFRTPIAAAKDST